MNHPFSTNEFATRGDLQQGVLQLFEPLLPYFSTGGARVRLAGGGGHYTVPGQGLEGFARPLWGIAPLAAGGGTFQHWNLYRRGLSNGVDPYHLEFWGRPGDYDQRFVECASLATAILLGPQQIWTPLDRPARENLTRWLNHINPHRIPDNNWHFFRVLANLALRSVDAEHNPAAMKQSLERIESYYLADGWYTDGPPGGSRDYYCAFAIHYYALIYARFAADFDRQRCERFKARAAEFALQFQHWFNNGGEAIAYGRSMTYRFAQASFWGALAFAGVEALPWGVIKGLLLRNLRTWSRRPIFHGDGVLSVGYGYPNLLMGEDYNGPGAPYWAMKSFLPLALSPEHPFWQADEAQLPSRAAVVMQETPGMILCHDAATDDLTALCTGQTPSFRPAHVAEKYNKFAYSTAFSFCVPWGREDQTADSTLALSEDGRGWRVRDHLLDAYITADGAAYSRWQPWADAEVQTWLWPVEGGHVRIHKVRTDRPLQTAEGGFALNIGENMMSGENIVFDEQSATLLTPHGGSTIIHLPLVGAICRKPSATGPLANRNLLHPRVTIPMLTATLPPGEHWLGCIVGTSSKPERFRQLEAALQTADFHRFLTQAKAFVPRP